MNSNSTVKLRSGNRMPVIGLGTWKLMRDTAETIRDAFEIGYRMIDTSGDYGTQPGIAEGIKMTGIPREDFFLVTKVEEYEDAYESTKNQLRQLELDHADLMLIHRPPPRGAGKDLWRGLIQAKKEGLTFDIGVSNYSIGQIEELIDDSGEIPVVNQIEWSPFGYSNEMLRFCKDRGIIIQAYSPLTRSERLGDKALEKISEKYGKTPAQLLIRWNLQLGTVPLPKANQKKHLMENLDVFDFEINRADMESLRKMNEKFSSLGALPYK